MKIDLTRGNPLRGMVLFALPIFLGNVFQQGYQMADLAVVSHVLGDDALAALGCTVAVYIVVVGLSSGLSNGFSLVVARCYGSRDRETMGRAVTAALWLWAGLSLFTSLAGLLAVEPLLRALHTPDAALDMAVSYLRVIFLGMPVLLAYNMLSGLLRGIGDSLMPLMFLLAAALCNIGLDLLLVAGFGMGVSGAAVATVIAEGFSVLLCLWYMAVRCPELRPGRRQGGEKALSRWLPDRNVFWQMLGTGLSMGLMMCFVDIGIMILQSAINNLGTGIVGGYITARRFHSVFMLALGTLGVTASTFASQNIGAGQWKRARQGVRHALFLALVWVGLVNVVVWLWAEDLVRLVTGSGNAEVLYAGAQYLRVDAPFYVGIAVLIVLRCALQGMGGRLLSLGEGALELSGNVVFALFVVPSMGYMGVCLCEPVTCTLCALYISVCYMVVVRRRERRMAEKSGRPA
ncbi:MATE family efflux transporter [uncultured Mailhella sp.]|uniref:MATE family efflux transporter n=1 Tax=uncultured Mailhella sp. TaxID=1981031 RepID=UPI0025F096FA|nr:MATE family efflux transporter [uncultured Mailhella sp.]